MPQVMLSGLTPHPISPSRDGGGEGEYGVGCAGGPKLRPIFYLALAVTNGRNGTSHRPQGGRERAKHQHPNIEHVSERAESGGQWLLAY